MKTTIPPGAVVIATVNHDAFSENRARYSVGGTVYVHPWSIWVRGDRAALKKLLGSAGVIQSWNDNVAPDLVTVRLGAFGWAMNDMRPAFTVDKFPHPWAPRELTEASAWVWTDSGAKLEAALPAI